VYFAGKQGISKKIIKNDSYKKADDDNTLDKDSV